MIDCGGRLPPAEAFQRLERFRQRVGPLLVNALVP
jgi:hypothetical protein